MEQGSLVGIILILVGVFVGAILKGVSPVFLFTIPAAILIVVVAAIGATFLSNTMDMNKNFGKLIGKAMKGGEKHEAGETISQVVTFADKARREGLLSLEDQVQKVHDEFLRKGLQMAIDGTDPEQVRSVLEVEVDAMKERHKSGQEMMTQVGVYAPSFGIIGAVFGLIATMAHLDDPEHMAHGISAAFVATFWGIFMANGLFLPFAKKLKVLSHHEIQHKTLLIEGVLSIQAGANPRVVEDMLLSFLPPAERVAISEERKSA
ncbi:MAG: motility protein A [Acidimicrobiia bacterium]